MAEMFRDDPAITLEVLNGILVDGGQAELLIVLRRLAQASGGVQAVAAQAHLNPTQLYRTPLAEGQSGAQQPVGDPQGDGAAPGGAALGLPTGSSQLNGARGLIHLALW